MANRSFPHISGLDIQATTLHALIKRHAQSSPHSDAIVSPGNETITFQDLVDEIENIRAYLASHGVGRGDHVGIMVRARDAMAVVHLGVQSIATSVPINPEATASELARAVDDFDLSALFTDQPEKSSVKDVTSNTGVPVFDVTGSHTSTGARFVFNGPFVGPPREMEQPQPDDVATLLYTSGSTATPKMVPQTNLNRAVAAFSAGSVLGISPGDRCLNVMPLFHTAGLHQELAGALVHGAAVVLAEFDPHLFPELLRQYRPTWFNLTPPMYAMAIPHLKKAELKPDELSLRFVRSGSALMPGELKAEIEATLNVPLVNAYGSSETSFIAMSASSSGDKYPGSVGRPHSGVILTDDSGAQVVTGDIGEIRVTGPTVITEYYKNPVVTEEQFVDGWYRTGDTGYLNEDGYLFIAGRLRDLINRGGEKISPGEVESILISCLGIEQAAVFAVSHPELGQEVHAACVLSSNSYLTSNEIRTTVAQQLAWAKVPKRVHIVDHMPLSSTGKILRSKLTEHFDLELSRS